MMNQPSSSRRNYMRGCLFSFCIVGKDLIPIYLCEKPRKKLIGGISKRKVEEKVCILYNETVCSHRENFPEQFDN